MWFYVKNINWTCSVCLTIWKGLGCLFPKEPEGLFEAILINAYWLSWFMYTTGAPVITQGIAMLQMFGDLQSMTSASCLLFTNISLTTKVFTMVKWRHTVQAINDAADEELSAEAREEGIRIVKRCNRETTTSLCTYMPLAIITCIGWTASAPSGQLPLTAWYPYNTTTSPAYEITYFIQGSSLLISAFMNVSFDNLLVAMVAVCCCRLRLVALSLRTVCDTLTPSENLMLSKEDEKKVQKRIQKCVEDHKAALQTAAQLQICFAKPIMVQFSMCIAIICVTLYQLALELSNKNWVRITSMIAYLYCMTIEAFLYCYQGNQLTEASFDIAEAAYSSLWYMLSVPLRRSLLIIMLRTWHTTVLTAAGITTLTLPCFASIMKASYTFFTVLNQVE